MKILTAEFVTLGADEVTIENVSGVIHQIVFDFISGSSITCTVKDGNGVDLLSEYGASLTGVADIKITGTSLGYPPIIGDIVVDRSTGGSINAFRVRIWVQD